MLKKAFVVFLVILPAFVYAWQGYSDAPVGITRSTQDFSLPTRGGLNIPGLSRSFYHGVNPSTGEGQPWYYATYYLENVPFPQFIPAGYWKFNIPFVRLEYVKDDNGSYANFYVFSEDGGCAKIHVDQYNVDGAWPWSLKVSPLSVGYMKGIEGFLHIAQDNNDWWPVLGEEKLYLLRRDGVTYEFQSFDFEKVINPNPPNDSTYIIDYKLNAVYGNTYNPSMENKITYHYHDVNGKPILESIQTSSEKIIKFRYIYAQKI